MTVSRALRNHPDLSEETKARVIQTARAMGYAKTSTPVATAESPTHKRVAVLAFEPADQRYPLFDSDVQRAIFLSLQRECQQQGVETVVEFPHSGEWPLSIKNGSATAAFIFGRYSLNDLIPLRGVPSLAVSSFISDASISRIVADNLCGMAEVTEHLITLGHRRILFLGRNEQQTQLHRERSDGYTVAMFRNGLTPEVRFVSEEDIPALLPVIQKHTALVCSADSLAHSLQSILPGLGISIPDQISLAGFDHLPSRLALKLTSYAPDWAEMGRLAASLLLFNSAAVENSRLKIIAPGHLILGDTTTRCKVP